MVELKSLGNPRSFKEATADVDWSDPFFNSALLILDGDWDKHNLHGLTIVYDDETRTLVPTFYTNGVYDLRRPTQPYVKHRNSLILAAGYLLLLKQLQQEESFLNKAEQLFGTTENSDLVALLARWFSPHILIGFDDKPKIPMEHGKKFLSTHRESCFNEMLCYSIGIHKLKEDYETIRNLALVVSRASETLSQPSNVFWDAWR